MDGVQIPLIGAGKTSDDSELNLDCGAVPAAHTKQFDTLTLGGCHQTGWQYGGLFRPADMFMDNACFYSKALNAEEIKSVMNGNILLSGAVEEVAEEEGCNASVNGGMFGLVAIASIAVALFIFTKKNLLTEGK